MSLVQGTPAMMNIECPCGHTFSVEVEEKTVIVKGVCTQQRVRRVWPCPECQMANMPPLPVAPREVLDESPIRPTKVVAATQAPAPQVVVATPTQIAGFMLSKLSEQVHKEADRHSKSGPVAELQDEEPLPHPNCKFHRRIEGELCSCDAWWEQEKIDCDRIEEMACKTCGDVSCEGDEACPENNIEHVRSMRDAARVANRKLRDERFEARKLLMEALALPARDVRRGKPKLADLACGALAVMGALRLQSFVLAAEMGLPEGRPSDGWEVVNDEWVKDGPKGSKIVVRCQGMKNWTWGFEMLALPEGDALSGGHATARGCMIQADTALARLLELVLEN